jgi:hypothetical protein
MKKMLMAIAAMLSLVIMSACQGPEIKEGDVTINNPAPTEPGPTGVNVFLKTQIAAGQYGIIQINRIIDGTEYDVSLPEDGFTLLAQTEYTYALDPGDYRLAIYGLNYNADAVFTVESGKMTVLVVTMTEWKVPTFYLWSTPGPPSGQITPGNHVQLYEFSVAHNWDRSLTPSDFGVLIVLQLGAATVSNCVIDIQTQTGYQQIGGPIMPSSDGYCDFTAPNDLDTSLPIHPYSANTYAVFCDINGQTGDTIVIGLSSFGAITDNGYLIGDWPDVYTLAF